MRERSVQSHLSYDRVLPNIQQDARGSESPMGSPVTRIVRSKSLDHKRGLLSGQIPVSNDRHRRDWPKEGAGVARERLLSRTLPPRLNIGRDSSNRYRDWSTPGR